MQNGSGGSGAGRSSWIAVALLNFCFFFLFNVRVSSAEVASTDELKPVKTNFCIDFILKIANARVVPFETPHRITRHIGKAAFYPLVALANLARYTREISGSPAAAKEWKTRFQSRLRKDVYHGLSYLSLVLAAQFTSIPYHQYDSQLNIQVAPKDHVVVVNGFAPEKKLHQFANYRFDTRYKHFQHVEKIAISKDWESMLLALKKNAAINGKAHLLELHGEAVPGAFFIQRDGLTGRTIRQAMTPAAGPTTSPFLDIFRAMAKEGIVEPDGIIVLYGCSAGSGERGEELMVSVGKLFAPQGAKVYASEVILTSSLLDQLFLDRGTRPPYAALFFRDAFDVGLPFVRLTRELLSYISATDPITVSANPVRMVSVEP